jgi:pimeloyl-ACP methyl ester carboxylesterase
MSGMSTYVLVHGAWHGSWCWKRVRRALQSHGHDVFTPTLTGLGERSHLISPQINLETHIDDVVNCIRWEQLSDVILCGHSYGGCVIRGAADRLADRIGALVYLDAFVPQTGQRMLDMLPPEVRNGVLDQVQTAGEGSKVPPIPAEAFHLNENDRDWVNRQCTFQPIETFLQPLKLTGAIESIRDITYVLAGGCQPTLFTPFYEKAQLTGWKTVNINCGHDVMLDEPEQLTQALLEVGESRVAAKA